MTALEKVFQELESWSKGYQEAVQTPPAVGSILTSITGEALLTVELHEDAPPFIYGKAFVPEIPDMEPKWVLQDEDHRSHHGLKCILMPRARADLIKKIGLSGDTAKVKSLRVIKYSQSGQSVLCEVNSYLD